MAEVPAEYRVVANRYPAIDGVEKVTGKAAYGLDIKLPGMLYGKVLRSPFPHVRIVGLGQRLEASPN